MRGLVAPSLDLSFDDRRPSITLKTGQQDALLRPYVLYWDRINYPIISGIDHQPSTEQQLLLDEGILSCTPSSEGFNTPWSVNIIEALVRGQFEAFDQLQAKEPGCWALAQEASRLHAPPELQTQAEAIFVELANVLPVPSYDVPLDVLLKFKQERHSELVALQDRLDELYQQVVSSGDVPHAKTAAIGSIERALADLTRAAKERFPTRIWKTVKVGLNLNPATLAAGVLAGAAAHKSMPLVAAGVALSTISVALSTGPKLSPEAKAFAYVHSAIREFGI